MEKSLSDGGAGHPITSRPVVHIPATSIVRFGPDIEGSQVAMGVGPIACPLDDLCSHARLLEGVDMDGWI